MTRWSLLLWDLEPAQARRTPRPWTLTAQRYIEASGKSVDLGRAVRTYTDEVIAFDRWVAERFIGQHLEEIESYQRALREHQARLRQLGLFNDPEAK
jgi:hypothetical protein